MTSQSQIWIDSKANSRLRPFVLGIGVFADLPIFSLRSFWPCVYRLIMTSSPFIPSRSMNFPIFDSSQSTQEHYESIISSRLTDSQIETNATQSPSGSWDSAAILGVGLSGAWHWGGKLISGLNARKAISRPLNDFQIVNPGPEFDGSKVGCQEGLNQTNELWSSHDALVKEATACKKDPPLALSLLLLTFTDLYCWVSLWFRMSAMWYNGLMDI